MEIYKDESYAWEEHEITDGFMDYKNPLVSNLLRGYPGGEKIRLGVLFFDKSGIPFFVRHLLDVTVPPGDDFKTPERNSTGNHYLKHYWKITVSGEQYYYNQHNAQIISLVISGLDISDVKDKIGGFMIVRCPIIHTNISDVFLTPVASISSSVLRLFSETFTRQSVWRKPNLYSILSPERLFNLKGFSIQTGDKLKNKFYLKPLNRTASNPYGLGFEITQGAFFGYVGKFYESANNEAPSSANGQIDAINEILFETKFELGEDDIAVNPLNENELLKKESRTHTSNERSGKISNNSIIVTKNQETGTSNYIGNANTAENLAYAMLCGITRPNDNPYGGLGDASLANSIYLSIGHFQEINDEVLADIEKDGKWIFDEIQIFGGDTFVNLFAVQRLYYDEDVGSQFNHTVIFPCESIINIAMRGDNHSAKNLPYMTSTPSGLRYKTGSHKWEDFNYNDGYSSDDIKDFYLPIPYNFRNESFRATRIRYSPQKSYGELRDNFRRFNALDFIDLDLVFGEISNVREKASRLIYWQEHAIGYIPINERALTTNQFGQPVQLGTGGIFERHDEIIDKMGNSNQLGLVESDQGFHWFDSIRRIFISMDNSMKLSEDSVIKGYDKFFNSLQMVGKDNPVFKEGIIGGYDYKNKIVYVTFWIDRDAGTYMTIGFALKINAFAGSFKFPAVHFIGHQGNKTNLIGIRDSAWQEAHLHTDLKDFGEYYGVEQEASFEMVFPAENVDPAIFDNLEITAGENLCRVISYDSLDKQTQDIIMDYFAGRNLINRDWSYRNNKWYGNIPLHNRMRLINDYLKIKFIFDSGFTYDQFITMVKLKARKAI